MSKIAVSSQGPTLDSQVDPRFGRAAGYIVIDPETMEHTYLDNGESQAMAHGAGIAAAQKVADTGASMVITGRVGPKASSALEGAGIRVVQGKEGITVQEAIDSHKAGKK